MNGVSAPLDKIVLTVPGDPDYGIVLRMALGGVGVINNLDIDRMDDLMLACDECVDLLTHQTYAAATITLSACVDEDCLKTEFNVAFSETISGFAAPPPDISRAILETLMSKVIIETNSFGVCAIVLYQPLFKP